MESLSSLDLIINAKTTKTYELIFTQSTGNYQDITGWTIYFTVKENFKDTDSLAKIRKDITSHSDASNGKTLIELSTVDTDLTGNYYYDIRFKTADNEVGEICSGRIKFISAITNRA